MTDLFAVVVLTAAFIELREILYYRFSFLLCVCSYVCAFISSNCVHEMVGKCDEKIKFHLRHFKDLHLA